MHEQPDDQIDSNANEQQIVKSTETGNENLNENLNANLEGNKVSKGKKKKKNKTKVNGLSSEQLNVKVNQIDQDSQSDKVDDNQSDKVNDNLNDKVNEIQSDKVDEIQSEKLNDNQSERVNDNQSDKMITDSIVKVDFDDKSIENFNIQIDTSSSSNNKENNLNGLIASATDEQTVEVPNEKILEESEVEKVSESNTSEQLENVEGQTKDHSNGKQNGKSNEVQNKIPELLLTENNLPNKSPLTTKLLIGAILIFKFFTFFIIKLIALFHPSKRCKLPPINEPLLLLRASQITEKIKSGELKCEQLIRAYINRIEQVQPKLNAVIDSSFEEAIKRAREIDELLKVPESAVQLKKLTLLGVPFTCKDSIAVKGLAWTAGVKIRKGIKANEDATVIKNLKKAGAIHLAITNTPELVLWYDSDNKIYGRTNNAYDLSRIVGGSSGGEGCLISAAGSLIGVGSDVAGSIRIPGMFNGVFGHKTIKKYVPVDMMFPAPPKSYDEFLCYGPIVRYASDLPIVLRAMGGNLTDELRLDEPVDLKKINKIYYMEHDGGNPFASFADQRIINAMHKALKHFKDEFGIESEKININKFKYSIAFFGTACVKGEMKIEDFVSPTGKVNVYWELFKSLFGKSDITRPILIQIINQTSPYCDPNSSSYLRFTKMLKELKPKVQDMLSDNAVLWMPTWPIVAPKHQTTILRGFDAAYTAIMNALELSATHCPMGLTKEEGLPLGFTVAASPGQDRISIAFAKEIERKFQGWVPPPTHQTN